MNAQLEAAGRPISAIYALLAAIAKQPKYALVTLNTGHFVNTGIPLKNL